MRDDALYPPQILWHHDGGELGSDGASGTGSGPPGTGGPPVGDCGGMTGGGIEPHFTALAFAFHRRRW
jgi:hypothetical protein